MMKGGWHFICLFNRQILASQTVAFTMRGLTQSPQACWFGRASPYHDYYNTI